MRAQIVPASGWFQTTTLLTEGELRALLYCGILPVNDKMEPLFEGNEKITLLYGGRGGGKSEGVADRLIDDCINEKYFKCYYGRKVFEDVRGSCFATLIESIKKRGLEKDFRFSEADSSSMVIKHLPTGNRFIPFGADKADRLKSIKDPTDVWCEEFDQFTMKDFENLFPTLRTTRGHNRFYASFNTEPVRNSHWIMMVFFPHLYTGTENVNTEMLNNISVKHIFINFPDNYFINQETYSASMLVAAKGDYVKYNAIAGGEWGTDSVDNPFWESYNPTRHVGPYPYVSDQPVHVVVDDNVVPYLAVALWQVSGTHMNQFHEIPAKTPNNNAPRAAGLVIDYLINVGQKDVLYLYGDTTSKKRSTTDADSQSFFQIFEKELKKAGFKVINRVGAGNPAVATSATFVNDIFAGTLGNYSITINKSCTTTTEDYSVVKKAPDGGMVKTNVNVNGETYQPHGHFSDNLRYFIVQLLPAEFKKYRSTKKKAASNWGAFVR